jgi:hypothetical protein
VRFIGAHLGAIPRIAGHALVRTMVEFRASRWIESRFQCLFTLANRTAGANSQTGIEAALSGLNGHASGILSGPKIRGGLGVSNRCEKILWFMRCIIPQLPPPGLNASGKNQRLIAMRTGHEFGLHAASSAQCAPPPFSLPFLSRCYWVCV